MLHIVQPVEGGVARVVTDLVRAQRRAGLDVGVACPGAGPLAEGVRRLGAEVHGWEAGRSPGPGLFGETRALAKVVKRVRPDLVHAHSAKAGLAARLAVRGRLPVVFQPHAWSFEAVKGPMAALVLRWERFATRWSSRVICVSEAERRTGERAGVDADYAVIPNGVDLSAYGPRGPLPAAVPGVPGMPSTPVVVCVGRLCRQKGQDVLLDAWPEVRRQIPGATLVLVGDGPDAEALRAAAPASVMFAGAAAETATWYRAADLVVLPSRWEGMALAPLEAMACGRPVVLSEVGGARESLPRQLASPCLVPPEDPRALAAALVTLALDAPLRTALAGHGLRHVRATHDVRHTAEAVAAVYRGVLGATAARAITEAAAVTTATQAREPTEVPKNPDTTNTPKARKNPSTTKATNPPRARNTPQTPTTTEVTEDNEATKAVEAVEATEDRESITP
ncbi:glycosyltransferase [Streptomyces tsukubensis]|uniref:Glycosyltransferase family 1 protein n=1 Tax=Streptomyces tsukubensis TaxID=83656 RepID=A0A1V4A553_9ACTN|nr:glycosyltransferase family 1 protein [Streptomyces tsukubensis]